MSAAPAQVTITLPDGKTMTFAKGVTGAEIAAAIGPGLAKAALILEVDGKEWDLFRPIEQDAHIRIITKKDDKALELIRHDAAHLLAMAVQELYPGTQVTIGPAIEDGFYYDFARAEPFTPGRPAQDRSQDARDREAGAPHPPRSVAARQGDRAFQGHRRDLQGRADRKHSRQARMFRSIGMATGTICAAARISAPPPRSATPSS